MLVYPFDLKAIKKAKNILAKGGVIIYPTDTLYGLGADIFNKKAVERISAIKGRDLKKPVSVMVSNIKMIKSLAKIDEKQEKLIKTILPGPFTILLKKKARVPEFITAGTDIIGLRIPNSEICFKLSQDFPITTTSANISNLRPSLNIKKIIKDFSHKVDLILEGKNLSGQPSIIIDLTKKPYQFLRF